MNTTPPITEFKQDTHCSYCGARFTEQNSWPRKCFICWNESYKNPIPIVCSMIPVSVDDKVGLLIQKRNIEPKKGGWAFPCGYINHGETWEEAAVRENEEEMHIYSRTKDYKLWGIERAASGNMLIFCTCPKIWKDRVPDFIERFLPNEEVSALGIWHGETELTFPTHTECGSAFLEHLQQYVPSPWTE